MLLFSWESAEETQKSTAWYATAGVILAAFVVWGFLMDYPVMSMVAMLFAGTYLYVENNSQSQISVRIGDEGVAVLGEFFDYPSLASFKILYENHRAVVLRLRTNQKAFSILDLPLPYDISIADLRTFLAERILEESGPTEFSPTESLLRRLKI